MQTGYASSLPVAEAAASDRATFIRNTYIHLAIALAAFVGLEAFLLTQEWAIEFGISMAGSWLLVIGAFMVVSWLADKWARSDTSRAMQYFGLGLYVVAQAVIFLPLCIMARYASEDNDIFMKAGVVTGMLFLGLTITAFITRTDFSFMRSILTIGGFVALGIIVVSLIFGFNLGNLFSGAMVLLAGGAVLYSTSNIIHHYRTDQYVAASLSLFAAVALMLWYVLRIFMSRD